MPSKRSSDLLVVGRPCGGRPFGERIDPCTDPFRPSISLGDLVLDGCGERVPQVWVWPNGINHGMGCGR